MASCSSGATSTATCGINRRSMSPLPGCGATGGRSEGRSMFPERLLNAGRQRLRARAKANRDAATADIIRQFQSETDAIRDAPEPRWARGTVLTLATLLVSSIVLMTLTRIDRIVSSTVGRIVATRPVNVYQALDASIIKSLDVRDGDEVQAGRLRA